MLKVYNTLSRKKEVFKPLKNKKVGLYTCGPTVYWYAHIGNLRTYIFEDFIRRILEYNDYKVKHVMNITDVGHLTSDADTGEDKMEKKAKKEKKTAQEIAEFYTQAFKKDLNCLNIQEPHIWCKVTDYIKEQIDLVKILEKKGFTYLIKDGVYFDSSKLKDYGKLFGLKKQQLKTQARIEMVKGKKNITDFALWKLTPRGVKRQQEWNSPWGKGFPGWHLECTAISIKHLGIPFDIHCGAIDAIAIHHTNEIAQAEAAFDKKFVNFWIHGEFLILPKGKMSKSEGNIITIQNLIKKRLNPLAFRYLCLTTHYRSKLNFSWQAMKGAQQGLNNLYQRVSDEINISSSPLANSRVIELKADKTKIDKKYSKIPSTIKNYQKYFLNFINNDLNMPKALALMWQLIKDKKISGQKKYALLLDFDNVLGLGLNKITKEKTPKEVLELVKKREESRKKGDWQRADEIRVKIKGLGYQIEDTKKGSKIKKL